MAVFIKIQRAAAEKSIVVQGYPHIEKGRLLSRNRRRAIKTAMPAAAKKTQTAAAERKRSWRKLPHPTRTLAHAALTNRPRSGV